MAKRREQADKKSRVRLNDLIRTLKAAEDILKLESGEKGDLKSFMRELRRTLNPYKNLSGNKFLDILKSSLLEIDAKQAGILHEHPSIQFDIQKVSLGKLKTLLSRNTLTKEQLLLVGKRRFGLSKGTLRKSKKEEVRDQIISAIENIETLNAIKRKAAE